MLNVTRVEPRGGYRLWLQFNDGAEGVVDLGDELNGPVFEPLREPAEFARPAQIRRGGCITCAAADRCRHPSVVARSRS